MTRGKSAPRLLVIDPDMRTTRSFVTYFEREGYQVITAYSGKDGLDRVHDFYPDLVLLAARLKDMTGLDVFRTLRDAAHTSHVPVMVLAGRNEMGSQNRLLEAGVYDVIEKPVDMDILGLRVRNALRRVEREGMTEPRTGLPTGRLIHDRLDGLARERDWCWLDLTVSEFDAFRDLYGFVAANEALRFVGNLIAQIVSEHGAADDFVGHVTGSEDFIVITRGALGPGLGDLLLERIPRELHSFYNFEERDRGYVVIEDGAGGSVERPLMSVQLRVTEPDLEYGCDIPQDAAEASGSLEDRWAGAADDDDDMLNSGPEDSVFGW